MSGEAEGETLYEKFMRANANHLGNPLIGAFQEALQLGHLDVGPEHLLLALLAGNPDAAAAEALGALGASHGSYEQALREQRERHVAFRGNDEIARQREREASGGVSVGTVPAYQHVWGFAQGFAAAHHAGQPDSLDFLIALLGTGPNGGWPYSVESSGITEQTVLEELKRRNVSLPVAKLPEKLRSLGSARFAAEAFAQVTKILTRDYPEGSMFWRIEVRASEAVVFSDPRIDLDAVHSEVDGGDTAPAS